MQIKEQRTFEEWSRWKLQYIPTLKGKTAGEGEKALFRALLPCASHYPERIEEWFEILNREKADPPWTDRTQIRHKINQALRLTRQPYSIYRQGQITITPDKKTIREELKRISQIAGTEGFFWWRSPFVPDTQSPLTFLKALYRPGDKLYITGNYKRNAGFVLTITDGMTRANEMLECHKRLLYEAQVNITGINFGINPISGQEEETQGRNGKALWCENTVIDFPYYVIEADEVLKPSEQLRMLASYEKPIVAITFSGHKSYHALIRINAPTKEQWKTTMNDLKPYFVSRGVDPNMFKLSQMSRLPGCKRPSKDNPGEICEQRLIYFNPNPDGRAIKDLPLRESRQAILERMRQAEAMRNEDSEPWPEIILPEGDV